MDLSNEQLAGHLYQTYCAEVGGKAFNGDPLPSWSEFLADPAKKMQCHAWLAVAADARAILCPGR